MNVAAIRRAVELRTGIYLTAEAVTGLANQALQEYAMHAAWPWLNTSESFTGDGTADFTLADAVSSIESVKIDGQPSVALSQAETDVWDLYPTRGGYGYSTAGSTLTIVPTPATDVAITVRYRRTEPVVADDDDEPLIPDTYAPMLYALTSAYACEYASDARSSFYREQARDLLRVMERSAVHKVRRGQQIRVRNGAPI